MVGLGWAVWPILFPPQAATIQSAASAPAPAAAVAEAPKPAPAPAAETAAPAPAAVPAPAVPPPAVAEAPKPAPAPTVPSTLSLADDNGVANVSGAVHDDKTRGSILDALKAAFGADNVKGDVAVDATRADVPWLPKLAAALQTLRIPGLKATFDGAAIKFGGAIPGADREKIAASLGSIFGSGVTVSSLAPSPDDWAATAYARAATALGALKAGASAADVVAALNLSTVHFDTDSVEIPTQTMSFLETAAARLKALPAGSEIEIAGYADDTGDAEANLALSQRRAVAVRDALVKAGVSADLLVAKGYGGADPIADNQRGPLPQPPHRVPRAEGAGRRGRRDRRGRSGPRSSRRARSGPRSSARGSRRRARAGRIPAPAPLRSPLQRPRQPPKPPRPRRPQFRAPPARSPLQRPRQPPRPPRPGPRSGGRRGAETTPGAAPVPSTLSIARRQRGRQRLRRRSRR